MHPFYAFILTLVNSIWQSAILLLLYFCVQNFYKNIHPLQKRNFLYSILFVQIAISILSYCSIKYQITWSNNFTIHTNWFTKIIAANENIIVYCYFGFVLLKLCSIGLQWSTFYFRYKKFATKPNASLRMYVSSHAAVMGITRQITLLYSTAINTPITFGFFKPVILLPFSICSQLSTKDIEAIILHELAHIKNKDYLLNWLLVCIEIIFVCNPFVHYIIKQIKLEREKNCDTTVIDFKYDSIGYAEALLVIAKNASGTKKFQIAFAKNGEQLLQRISFFCNTRNFIFTKAKGRYSLLLASAFLFILLIPSLQKEIVTAKNNEPIFASNIQQAEKWKAPITIKRELEKETINNEHLAEINFIEEQPKEAENVDSVVYFEPAINEDFKFASLIDTLQNTKEFIYKVETKNGTIINTYDLKFVNGKWILIPTYLIVQKYKDSSYSLQLDTINQSLDTLIQ